MSIVCWFILSVFLVSSISSNSKVIYARSVPPFILLILNPFHSFTCFQLGDIWAESIPLNPLINPCVLGPPAINYTGSVNRLR